MPDIQLSGPTKDIETPKIPEVTAQDIKMPSVADMQSIESKAADVDISLESAKLMPETGSQKPDPSQEIPSVEEAEKLTEIAKKKEELKKISQREKEKEDRKIQEGYIQESEESKSKGGIQKDGSMGHLFLAEALKMIRELVGKKIKFTEWSFKSTVTPSSRTVSFEILTDGEWKSNGQLADDNKISEDKMMKLFNEWATFVRTEERDEIRKNGKASHDFNNMPNRWSTSKSKAVQEAYGDTSDYDCAICKQSLDKCKCMLKKPKDVDVKQEAGSMIDPNITPLKSPRGDDIGEKGKTPATVQECGVKKKPKLTKEQVEETIKKSKNIVHALEQVFPLYGLSADDVFENTSLKTIRVQESTVQAPAAPITDNAVEAIMKSIGIVLDNISQRAGQLINQSKAQVTQAATSANTDPSLGTVIARDFDADGQEVVAYDSGMIAAPRTPAGTAKGSEMRERLQLKPYRSPITPNPMTPAPSYFTDEDNIMKGIEDSVGDIPDTPDMSKAFDTGGADTVDPAPLDDASTQMATAMEAALADFNLKHLEWINEFDGTLSLGYDLLQSQGFDYIKSSIIDRV